PVRALELPHGCPRVELGINAHGDDTRIVPPWAKPAKNVVQVVRYAGTRVDAMCVEEREENDLASLRCKADTMPSRIVKREICRDGSCGNGSSARHRLSECRPRWATATTA